MSVTVRTFVKTALKGNSVLFLFAITAAGAVPCGGPKRFPRTLSMVHIIFSFWSVEISEGILRNQEIILGLDSFSNQPIGPITIWSHFDPTGLCIDYPIERYETTVILFGFVAKSIWSLKRLE